MTAELTRENSDMATLLGYEAGVEEGRRQERERILQLRVSTRLLDPGGFVIRGGFLDGQRRGWHKALDAYRKRIRETGGNDGE